MDGFFSDNLSIDTPPAIEQSTEELSEIVVDTAACEICTPNFNSQQHQQEEQMDAESRRGPARRGRKMTHAAHNDGEITMPMKRSVSRRSASRKSKAGSRRSRSKSAASKSRSKSRASAGKRSSSRRGRK